MRRVRSDLPEPKAPIIHFARKQTVRAVSSPSPSRDRLAARLREQPATRAYIFDSWFEENTGVHFVVRVLNGRVRPGDQLIVSNDEGGLHEVRKVGVFAPDREDRDELCEGSVGFVQLSIKQPDLGVRALGKALISLHPGLEHPAEPPEPSQVVYASIFPDDSGQYNEFVKAVAKIQLEDPAVRVELEASAALGSGIRAGFLGELHLEVFKQRLKDEHQIETIVTPPSVTYMVKVKGHEHFVNSASELKALPPAGREFFERWAKLVIVARVGDDSALFSFVEARRGKVTDLNQISKNQITLTAEVPVAEVVQDFNHEIKAMTQGYASFEFELLDYRKADIELLQMTIMDEEVDAFAFLVHKRGAYELGKKLCQIFKDHVPPQLFQVTIRACIRGKPIAKEEIRATRKDVTAKCYGGDFSRRKKLLDRQKEGKERMKEFGKVRMTNESLHKIFKEYTKARNSKED